MQWLICYFTMYLQLSQGVTALYALEYIMLEGHCFDSVTSEPPRGLQFVMGTDANPAMVDTIVMANLVMFYSFLVQVYVIR